MSDKITPLGELQNELLTRLQSEYIVRLDIVFKHKCEAEAIKQVIIRIKTMFEGGQDLTLPQWRICYATYGGWQDTYTTVRAINKVEALAKAKAMGFDDTHEMTVCVEIVDENSSL